jgi:hypothetical protein
MDKETASLVFGKKVGLIIELLSKPPSKQV